MVKNIFERLNKVLDGEPPGSAVGVFIFLGIVCTIVNIVCFFHVPNDSLTAWLVSPLWVKIVIPSIFAIELILTELMWFNIKSTYKAGSKFWYTARKKGRYFFGTLGLFSLWFLIGMLFIGVLALVVVLLYVLSKFTAFFIVLVTILAIVMWIWLNSLKLK
jgi:hypothetical protein